MTPLSREQQLELDRNAAIKEAAAVTQEKKDLQKHLDYVIEEWNQSDAALRQQLADAQATVTRLEVSIDVICAQVNAQCENGCGTKARELLMQADAQATVTRLEHERDHPSQEWLAECDRRTKEHDTLTARVAALKGVVQKSQQLAKWVSDWGFQTHTYELDLTTQEFGEGWRMAQGVLKALAHGAGEEAKP